MTVQDPPGVQAVPLIVVFWAAYTPAVALIVLLSGSAQPICVALEV